MLVCFFLSPLLCHNYQNQQFYEYIHRTKYQNKDEFQVTKSDIQKDREDIVKKKTEADLRTHVPSKQWKLLPNGNMDLVLKMFQFFKRS